MQIVILFVQLLLWTIPASIKQSQTNQNQCSDRKNLQQLVERRRRQLFTQLFESTIPAATKQLLTNQNPCLDRNIHLQQLFDWRRSNCLFNCFHRQYLRRSNSCRQAKISFRYTSVSPGTVLSTHMHLFVQLVRSKASITAVFRRLIVKAWLLSGKKSI